jgi:phospholipase C
VLKTYTALVNSPNWRKTMLVITYDEHGGFFDHVLPPPAHDDKAAFRTYGVRVPAIVVSPFTPRSSVSNEVFDHTSIIKTILLRFCQNNGQIPNMGARVANANHLGSTLSLAQARPPTPTEAFRDAVDRIVSWRAEVFRSRVMMDPITTPADPTDLNDLQKQVVAARNKIRAEGLPEGQP